MKYITYKRFFDVTISLLLFLIAFPLFILTLALVLLDGHIQPFFTQRRLGLGGKEFIIYKFRTLKGILNELPTDVKPDAPELTAIASFLRRTGLDELPQLLNILKGDMSLIGPRPYAIPHGERYAALDKRYYERYSVRPGLACIVEATKLHYMTDTPKHFKTRISCDLYYIKHQSLSLDLRISFKILRSVLVRELSHMACAIEDISNVYSQKLSHIFTPAHVQRIAAAMMILFCIAPA